MQYQLSVHSAGYVRLLDGPKKRVSDITKAASVLTVACEGHGLRRALVITVPNVEECTPMALAHAITSVLRAPLLEGLRLAFVAPTPRMHESYSYAGGVLQGYGASARVFWLEEDALNWLMSDTDSPAH